MCGNRDINCETAVAGAEALAGDFALVGEVGCGKTALMAALMGGGVRPCKTQAAVFYPHNIVDTPGEFAERRAYYGALLATIVGVSTIVYLQAANSRLFSLPAGLLSVYDGKRVVGVVSKIDLPDADIAAARSVLEENGILPPYFETSAVSRSGVAGLRSYLAGLRSGKDGQNDRQ